MTRDQFRARYEIDYKWRDAWNRLADKFERGRLQNRQDKIELRANLANLRIGKLMRDFDTQRSAQNSIRE